MRRTFPGKRILVASGKFPPEIGAKCESLVTSSGLRQESPWLPSVDNFSAEESLDTSTIEMLKACAVPSKPEEKSTLLKGGYMGDYIGEYQRERLGV